MTKLKTEFLHKLYRGVIFRYLKQLILHKKYNICQFIRLNKGDLFNHSNTSKRMQKFILLIACLLATTTVATAQKKAKKEKEGVIKYGEIPEEDLKMTVYAPDSSADAVVLAAKGRLSVEYNFDGFKLHRHVLRRVKLLKKSSFNSEGNISIPYRTDGNFEDIWKLSLMSILISLKHFQIYTYN